MQYRNHLCNMLGTLLIASVAWTGVATATTAEPGDQSAVWKHHEAKFVYQGFTAKYTCDGLEGKIRQILLALGARKSDLKVMTSGCAYGPDQPSDFAWVSVDMHSLAAASSTEASPVKARWAAMELSPRRPNFMGSGECELVEQLKDLVSTGFATRDLEYRAGCMPHSVSLGDYRVRGQVLMPE